MNASIELLLALWDDLDKAAQRVLTSQPWQMTEAAIRLEEQRRLFREAINTYVLSLAKS